MKRMVEPRRPVVPDFPHVVRAHLAALQERYNASDKSPALWKRRIGELFPPYAVMMLRTASGRFERTGRGRAQIADIFFKMKTEYGVETIDFGLRGGEPPLPPTIAFGAAPLRFKVKIGPTRWISFKDLGLVSGTYIAGLKAKPADPDFTYTWSHIDICPWYPLDLSFTV